VSGFSADRFATVSAETTTTSPGRRGPEANII
jgi:sarcosine oxidase subunit beta